MVAVGCVATNSVNESPLRAAATGVVRGLVAFNDVAQQLDAAHGRAGGQGGRHAAGAGRRGRGGQPRERRRVLAGPADGRRGRRAGGGRGERPGRGHAAREGERPARRAAGQHADAGPGPVRDGHARGDGPAEWVEDLRVEHNAGRGWAANGRLLQVDAHPAAALRGFAADPAANVYQRVPAAGEVPRPAARPRGRRLGMSHEEVPHAHRSTASPTASAGTWPTRACTPTPARASP